MIGKSQPEWKKETNRRLFSQPYNFEEAIDWIKNRFFGPSHKYSELTSFIPSGIFLNPITPVVSLGFVGDIMPLRHHHLNVGDKLKSFFTSVDYLIGNFEGVFVSESLPKVFMAQAIKSSVLDLLVQLARPEKIVLSCANNHSADFGWNQFEKSYQYLKEQGFNVFGRRDEPNLKLDHGINLACGTQWTNQPGDFVAKLEESDLAWQSDASLNLLYPHWGYEFHLYPGPTQISLAKEFLGKWDAIIGQHSHTPQPISQYQFQEINKLVAYSVGNFSFGYQIQKVQYGIALKLEIGPMADERWAIGNIEWVFTHLDFKRKLIEIVSHMPFGLA